MTCPLWVNYSPAPRREGLVWWGLFFFFNDVRGRYSIKGQVIVLESSISPLVLLPLGFTAAPGAYWC